MPAYLGSSPGIKIAGAQFWNTLVKRGTLKKTVLSIISPNQYSRIDKKEAGELPFDRFYRLSTSKLSSLSNVGANDGSMALKCDHTSRESSRNISLAPCVTNILLQSCGCPNSNSLVRIVSAVVLVLRKRLTAKVKQKAIQKPKNLKQTVTIIIPHIFAVAFNC